MRPATEADPRPVTTRSRITICVVVAVAAVLAGCAGPKAQRNRPADLPTSASPTPTLSERAAVLTAVLRNYLSRPSDGAPSGTGTPVVYVLDHTDRNAADAMPHSGATEAISVDDQQAIVSGLAGVASVTFVPDGKGVIEAVAGCPRVRGGATLVTLGTPVQSGHDLHVGFASFRACLDGLWLTYVVSANGGWHVTGTTGPVGIA